MQDDPITPSPAPAAPSPPLISAEIPPPANLPWAKDLRELYNAVVEEPLPDSFMVLLAQLDTED